MASDSKEAIALFLLKGGKVNRVPADRKKLLTDGQWYRKTRDTDNAKVER